MARRPSYTIAVPHNQIDLLHVRQNPSWGEGYYTIGDLIEGVRIMSAEHKIDTAESVRQSLFSLLEIQAGIMSTGGNDIEVVHIGIAKSQ